MIPTTIIDGKRDHSEESLLLDVSHLLINMISEALDSFRVNMPVVVVLDETLGVVLVLDFHTSELANVNIGSEVAAGGHSLSYTHI